MYATLSLCLRYTSAMARPRGRLSNVMVFLVASSTNAQRRWRDEYRDLLCCVLIIAPSPDASSSTLSIDPPQDPPSDHTLGSMATSLNHYLSWVEAQADSIDLCNHAPLCRCRFICWWMLTRRSATSEARKDSGSKCGSTIKDSAVARMWLEPSISQMAVPEATPSTCISPRLAIEYTS